MDSESSDVSAPRYDRLAVMRVPDFRRYWFGGALAAAGGQMTGVAVGWELYERTNRHPLSKNESPTTRRLGDYLAHRAFARF